MQREGSLLFRERRYRLKAEGQRHMCERLSSPDLSNRELFLGSGVRRPHLAAIIYYTDATRNYEGLDCRQPACHLSGSDLSSISVLPRRQVLHLECGRLCGACGIQWIPPSTKASPSLCYISYNTALFVPRRSVIWSYACAYHSARSGAVLSPLVTVPIE